MRFRRALIPFVAVAGMATLVLVADQYRLRPIGIPKPASADSIAGVVARLVGGDSVAVGRIGWYRSPERALFWVAGEEYAYRGPQSDLVPVTAQADLKEFAVTFAKGTERNSEIIKHELAHLLIPVVGHPADVFVKLEAYRGR